MSSKAPSLKCRGRGQLPGETYLPRSCIQADLGRPIWNKISHFSPISYGISCHFSLHCPALQPPPLNPMCFIWGARFGLCVPLPVPPDAQPASNLSKRLKTKEGEKSVCVLVLAVRGVPLKHGAPGRGSSHLGLRVMLSGSEDHAPRSTAAQIQWPRKALHPPQTLLLWAFMISQNSSILCLVFWGLMKGRGRASSRLFQLHSGYSLAREGGKWATSRAVLGNIMETVVLYLRRNAHRWEC